MLAHCGAVSPVQAQLWKHIVRASHVEAPSEREEKLTQDNGPWLVMATSFQGEGAEQQATELVRELRDKFRLVAYVHDRQFDFAESKPGRGLDNYGAPLRTRYQREQAHEFAVLVGDFESLDDPKATTALERVKTIEPACMKADGDADSTVEQVKQISSNVMDKLGKKKSRGPMGKAFLARNPLLPREYFVPKGIDSFVAKMNQGVENSLLNCPGRYTVQVASFQGRSMLQTKEVERDSEKSGWPWKKEKANPLVEAAEDAHLLCAELRSHGYEAYEFHDRTESLVTIGSFDQVAMQSADGRLAATPQVQRIVETFGAAYDTPADPLTKIGNDARNQRKVDEVKNQFNQVLATHNGQVAQGLHPKHVKIIRHGKTDRVIPIEIYPHAIEVPRQSVSSAYAEK